MIVSADRLIQDVAPLVIDAGRLLELEPVTFRHIDAGDARRLGFRAEAVQAAGLPELVTVATVPGAPDEGMPVAVDLEGYVVALHAIVRELAGRLLELENRSEGMTNG